MIWVLPSPARRSFNGKKIWKPFTTKQVFRNRLHFSFAPRWIWISFHFNLNASPPSIAGAVEIGWMKNEFEFFSFQTFMIMIQLRIWINLLLSVLLCCDFVGWAIDRRANEHWCSPHFPIFGRFWVSSRNILLKESEKHFNLR